MLFLTGCAAGRFPRRLCHHGCPSARNCETAGTPQPAGTRRGRGDAAPTADAVQPPQGLVETGAAVLDYDEIRLLRYSRELQSYPEARILHDVQGRQVGPDAQRRQ